ncbi:MAG: adenosylcobinamide-GDP ribazoletransferase [Chloroflexi bacterium]|nr:adenosylcobinamide-GDP ribazoletransferase [Chloroflexota bacterium]
MLWAFRFLTVLPLPVRREATPDEWGRGQVAFPIVGLAIGLILVGLDAALGRVWPPVVVNGLLILAAVLLTGGLHQDGLMDSCDGLFAPRSPKERLEIMRDSRVGSFGVLGLVLVVLLKYGALMGLPPAQRVPALLLAPTLGRWTMVAALRGFPYARPVGLGAAYKAAATTGRLALATLVAAATAAAIAGALGLAVLGLAAVWTFLAGRWVLRRIPGLTGDTYGAINETVETVVLLAMVAI